MYTFMCVHYASVTFYYFREKEKKHDGTIHAQWKAADEKRQFCREREREKKRPRLSFAFGENDEVIEKTSK